MRILIVNTFYYPNMEGGAEQSVKLLAEHLVKEGHEVGIFCIDSKNQKEYKEYNGVKIFRYTAHKFNLFKFTYDKKNIGKLEKIQQKLICYYNKGVLKDFEKVCDEFKPDVVHTNTLYGMSNYIWKVCYKKKIPAIHTIRDIGLISPVQYGRKVNKFIVKAHRIYTRRISNYVTAVTAPSNYTLSTTLEIGTFKKASIKKCIFNSVEIDKDKMIKVIKEKEKRESEKITLLYSGRLIYFKGIEHMIKAFRKIENNNLELVICGDGEMRDFVEQNAKEDHRINYLGKLSKEKLDKEYEKADILLVPSYWPEPFGRVLIEGNLYGLPVIAGNCGGMPEIIENTKGGVVYTPASEEELREKIIEMSNRKVIKSYMNEIEKNIEIYDIKNQINSFTEIYNEIKKKGD